MNELLITHKSLLFIINKNVYSYSIDRDPIPESINCLCDNKICLAINIARSKE